MNKVSVITLDGPSGTGKGTICQLLANELGWHFLDSGALYRVLAYAARQQAIKSDDVAGLVSITRQMNLHFESTSSGESGVFLDGHNISQAIRTEQCGQDASKIAVIPEVREALLQRQRDFARAPGLVTDGRDMGTVVFPEAQLKLFLYATAEERAKRRYFQLKDKGIDVSLAEVVDDLGMRDARDTARTHAPLKAAEDAVLIDTTGLTVDQVFQNVLKLVNERLLNS